MQFSQCMYVYMNVRYMSIQFVSVCVYVCGAYLHVRTYVQYV